jgi:hypothetical protein
MTVYKYVYVYVYVCVYRYLYVCLYVFVNILNFFKKFKQNKNQFFKKKTFFWIRKTSFLH